MSGSRKTKPAGDETAFRMNAPSAETVVRLASFTTVFLLMSAVETLVPRRRNTARKPVRWLSNLALTGLNAGAMRILVPLGATGVAMVVAARGWGILNVVSLPAWASALIAVIAL